MNEDGLIKENNEMLKEILTYVRKVDSKEYRENTLLLEFLCNVSADILVEMMEPEQRKEVYNILINQMK